jgi:CheY-like chemotaxis protein
VSITGPALQLTPAAAQALALVIHELATNSAKYGALSVEVGVLQVEWDRPKPDTDSTLILGWIENGGPPVKQPERRGFGSVVLQTSVERQLGGTVNLDWRSEGLQCRIEVPAAETVVSGYLPVAQQSTVSGSAPAVSALAVGAHILVVEDEALIAAQIEDVLGDAGYVVRPASRLAEAFNLFYRKRPDAALLDINVAGESSFPLAEFLTAKGVPFAFCSGYGEAGGIPEQFRHIPLIAKPAAPARLIEVFSQLNNPGLTNSLARPEVAGIVSSINTT